jgi:hypothetical protein
MYKKYILLLVTILVLLINKELDAQINAKSKLFQNQIDFGINYGLFSGNRDVFNGIGWLQRWDFKREELWYPYQNLRRLNYTNIYLSYKFILKEKHYFKLSREVFSSDGKIQFNKTGIIGFHIDLTSFGYGYNLPTKKIKTTLFLQVNKRTGLEVVKIGYDGYHTLKADLNYNSYGISTGAELEYFFTKNLGLGANIYYYYFPNETNKLEGKDVQYVDKMIIDSYKPINDFFLINFKLAYKFSFPKFKKNK